MAGIRSILVCSELSASSRDSLGLSRRAFPWQTRPSPSPRATSWLCTCQLSPLPPLSKPLIADHEYSLLIKSLPLPNAVLQPEAENCTKMVEGLQEITQKALQKTSDPTVTMKLIDTLQRLGISYHFDDEIDVLLQRFSEWDDVVHEGLFTTALRFRLLRHNGYPTSSDVFDKFINKEGKFKESLIEDIWGMLSLYEASYLGGKGEYKLSHAMEFTKTHLIQSLPLITPEFGKHIARALDLPRHLRMASLEARNYIDEYSSESNYSSALLELARLDFNKVQLLHERELTEIFRWWKELGLVDKLSFARDRPLECFLWTVGIFPEPCQSTCRIELTKTISILFVIDDIFDSYGSLPELILFTESIQRWDLSAMEQLPEYMKICYMALYNTTNDIAYRVLKEHGWNIVPHLRRTWIDIIEAYLVEAKWFNSGYVPTLDEYLANAVITGGTCMALVHAFFLMGQDITEETVAMMKPYPKLFSCSGTILRLWDDLGTAREEQERGDVASSIECIMKDKNILLEDGARKCVRELIRSLWVELNSELMAPTAMPLSTIKAAFNLSRTAQVIYQHGDDNKISSVEDHVQALLFKPIALHVLTPPNHCIVGQGYAKKL